VGWVLTADACGKGGGGSSRVWTMLSRPLFKVRREPKPFNPLPCEKDQRQLVHEGARPCAVTLLTLSHRRAAQAISREQGQVRSGPS
jgi:hypothetical protein